jgi:hypothetical protein
VSVELLSTDSFLCCTCARSSSKQPRTKQAAQPFRDDYIVKEVFDCWTDFIEQQARLLESRRKRVMIDFREFWFQDALTNPFYSYFEQPVDYRQQADVHHQAAYRQHRRLVRAGREQPKETSNNRQRSSFFSMIFDLPRNRLERRISLHRRYEHVNERTRLKHVLVEDNDLQVLIHQRIQLVRRHRSLRQRVIDVSNIEQKINDSSLVLQGTIHDLDGLIKTYFASIDTNS